MNHVHIAIRSRYSQNKRGKLTPKEEENRKRWISWDEKICSVTGWIEHIVPFAVVSALMLWDHSAHFSICRIRKRARKFLFANSISRVMHSSKYTFCKHILTHVLRWWNEYFDRVERCKTHWCSQCGTKHTARSSFKSNAFSALEKVKASILLCIFFVPFLMYIFSFHSFCSTLPLNVFHSCFQSRFVVSEHSCLLIVDMFIVRICGVCFHSFGYFNLLRGVYFYSSGCACTINIREWRLVGQIKETEPKKKVQCLWNEIGLKTTEGFNVIILMFVLVKHMLGFFSRLLHFSVPPSVAAKNLAAIYGWDFEVNRIKRALAPHSNDGEREKVAFKSATSVKRIPRKPLNNKRKKNVWFSIILQCISNWSVLHCFVLLHHSIPFVISYFISLGYMQHQFVFVQ